MSEKKTPIMGSPTSLEGRLPLRQAIPLGMQHVFAMFAGNLTPILLITTACGIASGSALQITLLQHAMLIAGIMTLVQIFTIGPIGARLPIVMGISSGFIGVCRSVAGVMGGGIIGYGAILGAGFVGGLFEVALGFCLKPLRKFFPPVVTGVVVLSIGLSLISVGISSFGGGSAAKDYGSPENLLVGLIVLIAILLFKHKGRGIFSSASILFGIIIGYIVCGIMALILPTVAEIEGAQFIKGWVLQWDNVAAASWFAMPKLFPVKLVFDMRAIIPIGIMFIVTAVETVGDISGVAIGGLGRDATNKELSGGVIADGTGSFLASLFGVLPNTSFSQNVGLISMTKVVNRFSISLGGVFLVLCGLLPKLAAIISIMPQSVLGGAAVMMFASIAVSGIQLITKEPITTRTITIISVSLGLGYGLGANSAALRYLPGAVSLIFGGSGIVPAAITAIILNIIIREEKKGVTEKAKN
jgi:uracil-xanthine permease